MPAIARQLTRHDRGTARIAVIEDLQQVLALDVDEAHRFGKRTRCRSFGGEGLRDSVLYGCDSIEHGYNLTQELCNMAAEKGRITIRPSFATTEAYMNDNDDRTRAASTG